MQHLQMPAWACSILLSLFFGFSVFMLVLEEQLHWVD
jgi:hypothetical protein